MSRENKWARRHAGGKDERPSGRRRDEAAGWGGWKGVRNDGTRGGDRKGEKEWVRVGLYYSITEGGGLLLSYLEAPSTPYMLIALTS